MGRLIDETELEKYIIHDECEKGCGYIDERNLKYIPTIEAILKADVENILDEIKTELYATVEMHDDGDYYLREEWIGEIFDNARRRHEICK